MKPCKPRYRLGWSQEPIVIANVLYLVDPAAPSERDSRHDFGEFDGAAIQPGECLLIVYCSRPLTVISPMPRCACAVRLAGLRVHWARAVESWTNTCSCGNTMIETVSIGVPIFNRKWTPSLTVSSTCYSACKCTYDIVGDAEECLLTTAARSRKAV
ncbi:hypothetical protein F5883DRAFT_31884 [Diaporthe sp. PMI_573]|nr:hypothetical protein F5883DRAFT_31884 [Diaporthaceae sp. PMI_573]